MVEGAQPNAGDGHKQVLCLEDVTVPNYEAGEGDFPN